MDVYASDLTKKNFPIVERAAELAPHTPLERLYVISPEDILTPKTAEEMQTERAFQEGKMTQAAYDQFAVNHERQSPAVLREFLDTQHPEVSLAMDDLAVEELALSLMQAYESVRHIDSGIDSNINNSIETPFFAIVATTYADASKEFLAAGYSKLPIEGFEILPGNDDDWRSAGFLHELGHLSHLGYNIDTLKGEVIAEKHMQRSFPKLFNEVSNALESQKLDHAIHAVRSLGAFNNQGIYYSHITSAAMRVHNEGHAPTGRAEHFENGLSATQYMVNRVIAGNVFPTGHYIDAINSILTGYETHEGAEILNISIEDQAIFKEMISNPNSMLEIMSSLSPESQEYFNNAVANIDNYVGGLIGKNNPQALFEGVRIAYQNGLLDDNPIGKQYAYEYLEAARTYMPTLHGANLVDAFEPPVFDEDGKVPLGPVTALPEVKSTLGQMGL